MNEEKTLKSIQWIFDPRLVQLSFCRSLSEFARNVDSTIEKTILDLHVMQSFSLKKLNWSFFFSCWEFFCLVFCWTQQRGIDFYSYCRMAQAKTKKAKKNDAILHQFNKVPRPSPNDALKTIRRNEKKYQARDFNWWWDKFLAGVYDWHVLAEA